MSAIAIVPQNILKINVENTGEELRTVLVSSHVWFVSFRYIPFVYKIMIIFMFEIENRLILANLEVCYIRNI